MDLNAALARLPFRPTQKSWPMPSNETNNEQMKSDAAPKSGESGSGRPREGQKSNSVYDFLYHDARRIASFLAQFETYGVLQQVKATEVAARTESAKHGLTTGLSVAIARAGTAQDVTTGSEERDSAERTYDPLWTNARTLLNYLADREMIVRDLSQAQIGQFVLVTGNLAAFDLGIFEGGVEASCRQRRSLERGGTTKSTCSADRQPGGAPEGALWSKAILQFG